MNADIQLTRDDELMVVQAEGLTDEGIEFVDAFYCERLTSVDAGRIVIHTDDQTAFMARAIDGGLVTLVDQVER